MNRKRTEIELKLRRELIAIKERREPELLRRRGVVGVGVGRDEIIVFIEREKVVDPTIPEEIEGKRIRFVKTERFKAL